MQEYDIENEQDESKIKIQTYQWHEVFYAVFTQPKIETFQRLLQDPQAKAQRAYLWMILPSMLRGMAAQALLASLLGLDILSIALLGTVFGGIFGVIRFIVVGWVLQRIAIFFGGSKTGYGAFHSARGMFMPVLVIAYAFISLLIDPESSITQFVFSAFLMIELLLTGIALRAVNDLSWGQTVMTVTTWYLLIAVLIASLGLF